MNVRKIFGILVLFALSISIMAQDDNPNLITGKFRISIKASSAFSGPTSSALPYRIADEMLHLWWETDKEKEGAWISIKWNEPQKIRELWIVNNVPYDIGDPYDIRTANYMVPRNIKVSFSDGTAIDAELRLCEYYQIITLPREIVTNSVKITIEKVWDGIGELNTGLCKVKAFSKPNSASFKVNIFEMYDVLNEKPVQSAKIEIVNPGSEIKGAKLLVMQDGKNFGTIELNEIPANSATIQQIWIPAVYSESKLAFQ